MEEKIAVIGAGAWGTTLAILLGKKGYDVNLWVHNLEHASKIKKGYLPFRDEGNCEKNYDTNVN